MDNLTLVRVHLDLDFPPTPPAHAPGRNHPVSADPHTWPSETDPHNHRVNEDGNCLEECRHPDHEGPVLITLHPALKTPLRDWLAEQNIDLSYFPTEPGSEAGMPCYVTVLAPDHPINRGTAIDHLRPRR